MFYQKRYVLYFPTVEKKPFLRFGILLQNSYSLGEKWILEMPAQLDWQCLTQNSIR